MTSIPCSVAVDVGNTAIKLAVQKNDQVIDHAIAIDQSQWQTIVMDWVREHAGCGKTHWRISSVHRRAAEKLIAAIKDTRPPADIDIISHRDVPMKVAVDHPDQLGIDRLLSAYAASRRIETDKRSGGMVVIDAGSAITIDFVDHQSIFRGGSIMPGLELQARSLAAGTDALPQITWQQTASLSIPATNTHDAILSGILLGTAGAIDRLVDCLIDQASVPTNVPVIMTGGNADLLTHHLNKNHHRFSNLVCCGLLELH